MTGVDGLLAAIADVGRAPSGGYERFAWTGHDLALREWFAAEAAARGLAVTVDRAGNQWAWWGDPDADGPGVVTGSHLDSVPGGGAFDGPLGVAGAFAALDALRASGVMPLRPLGIVNFSDEEGARFGLACLGSRALTGTVPAERLLGLRDGAGDTLADVLGRDAGVRIDRYGHDPEALARVGVFVELHVEQGRYLADLVSDEAAPVAVGAAIWPHGRWRVDLAGEANHAGTTPLAHRHDPMLDLARLITDVRAAAEQAGALATLAKVEVEPNGVNAIPSRVRAWIDARGETEAAVRAVLTGGSGPAPSSTADFRSVPGGRAPSTADFSTRRPSTADILSDRPSTADLLTASGGLGVTKSAVGDGGTNSAVGGGVAGGDSVLAGGGAPDGLRRWELVEESWTPATVFDPVLAARLADLVGRPGSDLPAPVIGTGAGHDAGILAAAGVPTAMLFVRNPTGVSHSPAEHADPDDCAAGVQALTAVLADLLTAPTGPAASAAPAPPGVGGAR
ncbi:allantoate amidohydrolase [Promicromonospora thailandica]|uniref:allantoate amidohydrolase n=1 Tax=Promicromonospora thailandica TaxID=765201 RepID=UPI0020A443D3|nr:allantoate amidohydrolase [Promicromonospora thailandica]